MDGPVKQKTVMVTVECIVNTKDPTKPTFRVRGVAQQLGDRGRLPYRDALDLERRGKAKIIWGTEEVEML
jgi:hypothetical protein